VRDREGDPVGLGEADSEGVMLCEPVCVSDGLNDWLEELVVVIVPVRDCDGDPVELDVMDCEGVTLCEAVCVSETVTLRV